MRDLQDRQVALVVRVSSVTFRKLAAAAVQEDIAPATVMVAPQLGIRTDKAALGLAGAVAEAGEVTPRVKAVAVAAGRGCFRWLNPEARGALVAAVQPMPVVGGEVQVAPQVLRAVLVVARAEVLVVAEAGAPLLPLAVPVLRVHYA